MVERFIPGKNPELRSLYLSGTPTVPLKRHAIEILLTDGTDPKLSKAVVEFVDAAYWIDNKIGEPDKHRLLATRRAQRHGLSEEDSVKASQIAQTIYADYKRLAVISQDTPLTRSIIATVETRKRKSREVKPKLEKHLMLNFKRLMGYSDEQLRVINSNERVALNNDSVYVNGGDTIKKRIKIRELTERQYQQAQERQSVRLEKSEDPYARVASILALAESNNPQSVEKLAGFLRSDDELIRQAAVDALDQSGWKPKTPTELTFYFIAKNEWDKVIILGDDALPALLSLMRNHDSLIRDKTLEILEQLTWKPEDASPEDQAAYYAVTEQWSRLEELDDNAVLSIAQDLLKTADPSSRRSVSSILEKKDTPDALRILARFKNDQDEVIRQDAKNAAVTLSENPFYLQKIVGDLEIPIVRTILSGHPEWTGKPVSRREIDDFISAVSYLPPVGGKIIRQSARRKSDSFTNRLDPSLIVEDQIRIINSLRQRKELGKAYIHQLTVQGRLTDEFKYVALALILSSPYSNDWTRPFFSTVWGTVAPLVHDGGYVQTGINLSWRKVEGRTDFLQRIVPVHQANLEELEKLNPEERAKQPIDTLVNARSEQEERERLIVEAKGYQRLALALHAKEGTAPDSIPEDIKQSLANSWQDFRARMDMLFGEYAIKGTVQVPWFNKEPHKLKGWETYGLRHEAEWPPIQKELIFLEQARGQYPELRQQVRYLLIKITNDIDREIGLLPKTQDPQS